MAHEFRQGVRHVGVGLEFEAGNAVGPREGVAHGGYAGVEWAGMFDAIAADGLAQRKRANGAAQGGLGKAVDTRRTQGLAGPAAADVTKSGPTQHATYWKYIASVWVEAQRTVCERHDVDNRGHV